MREIALSPTRPRMAGKGEEPNPPVTLYDTAGPYTDPAVTIDVTRGLAPIRLEWIRARGDVEELPGPTSSYGQQRLADARLASVRFPNARKPLRAKPGQCVTQMHYARQGIITPEMEFIAIRENQRRDTAPPPRRPHHVGQAWGAAPSPRSSRPSSSATRLPVAGPSSPPTSTTPKSNR